MRGYDLVALIFAREINDDLTGLVRKLDRQLDETAKKHKRTEKFGVFVILLRDDAEARQQLKCLIAEEGLKHVVLSTTDAEGGNRNKLAKEAGVTVAVYHRGHNESKSRTKVTANFALEKDALCEGKADAILEAVTRVLPK